MRGHFFYSQSTASVPSFLWSLHPSVASSFCSLLSAWNAFTQVLVPCHPACLTKDMPSVFSNSAFSCLASWASLCKPSAGCICLLLCLQVEHSSGFLPSPDFCYALLHLPFSIRYLTPYCHKLWGWHLTDLAFSLLLCPSCSVFWYTFTLSWQNSKITLFLCLLWCSEYFHTVLLNPAVLLHCSVLPWQGLHCSLLCSPAVSVHHCCLEHFQFQSGALQSLSAAFPGQEIPEAHCLVGLCACAGCRSRPAGLDTHWPLPACLAEWAWLPPAAPFLALLGL